MKIKFRKETIWSSSLQRDELPRIRAFLRKNGFEQITVSLMLPKSQTTRQRWATYYKDTGQPTSILYDTPIPVGTSFLKLASGYSTTTERDAGRPDLIRAANALRLMFGVPIARELVLVLRNSENQEQMQSSSDIGFASFFDTQALNLFVDPPIEGATLREIPIDASVLLDKAFTQKYPEERFILLWLAFEAIINSLPGHGHSGDKRKRYFLEELKSEVANEGVYDIFLTRCDVFKEGKMAGGDLENKSWSLFYALQLVVLKECPQRAAYLRGYEAFLSKKLK